MSRRGRFDQEDAFGAGQEARESSGLLELVQQLQFPRHEESLQLGDAVQDLPAPPPQANIGTGTLLPGWYFDDNGNLRNVAAVDSAGYTEATWQTCD
jgi:hypothetical protein